MKEQKEVKVSKMVIQLTDEQISLSMNEAKKLYEALAELFGKKTVEHIYHDNYWSYRPYRWYGDSIFASSEAKYSAMQMAGGNNLTANLSAANALSKYTTAEGVSFQAKGATLMCNLKETK